MAADDEKYDDDYQDDNNPDDGEQFQADTNPDDGEQFQDDTNPDDGEQFGENNDNRNDDNNGDNVQQPQAESDNNFKGGLAGLISNIGGSAGGIDIRSIVGKIGHFISNKAGERGLTNGSGVNESSPIADLISNVSHRFFGVEPETGRIIGSIAGNVIFNMGGQHNSLGQMGKLILDNIISGKYQRKIKPFVSKAPDVPALSLNFNTERDRCLSEKTLFEDPEFPANDKSLYFSRAPSQQVEWKRPAEIIENPLFVEEGHTRFDVVQGALGDCWLMAAIADLTIRDELFYRVVPPDQSFTENYAGIFHFQFWHYGSWVDVVIDDRLPTSDGQLLYTHSENHNEFWSALLEKAYAKLYGSYEALKGGETSEALEDFTGGLSESFDLKNTPHEQILDAMLRAFPMGSLAGCSIEGDPRADEAKLSTGLVCGHAYSITAIQTVNGPNGQTVIIRIRNPWGNDDEWNGAWSDDSSEWQSVSDQQKQEMNVVFAKDGEFWMSFQDFVGNFERLEICNLGPEVFDEVSQMTGVSAAGKSTDRWSTYSANGAWRSDETAGGCRNNPTFADNPQYQTTLSSGAEADGRCTVIVAVMQKYRRELSAKGMQMLAIGIDVFAEDNETTNRMDASYFESATSVGKTSDFINSREVTTRFRVPPSSCIVVASTFDPNQDAEFLLRVFVNGQINGTLLS